MQRILIAEDDEAQGAMLVAAMQRSGYSVDIVDDGLEAVRNLRTGDYDLALLDYNMPQVNGRAVAQLLQDLPEGVKRPRLIAITASPERLNELELVDGSSSFDAIVSKTAGFPALFEIVKQNLMVAAELNATLLQARDHERTGRAKALRKQRRRAPLFALPGLAMAACFAVALSWSATSLHGVAASINAAQSTVALSTDAQVLVGAVAEAQASQRSYLVTGSEADRAVFDEDQQRVDRLLSAPTALNPSHAPGFAQDGSPIPVIQPLLHTLGEEARRRSTLPAQAPNALLSSQSGRATAEKLQSWANALVAQSQDIVVTGLQLVRQNMQAVIIILIAGCVYGLWTAGAATWRQWTAAGPGVRAATVGSPTPAAPITIRGVAESVNLRVYQS